MAAVSGCAGISQKADAGDALRELQLRLDAVLDGRPVHVLDAGCGARRYINLTETAYIVGLDLSATDLDRNAALNERIVGDVESFPLHSESFDVVLCWDVLEHLPHPARALDNLSRTLRSGGLLVLAGPNPLSLKGIASWLTPYWLHRLSYRVLATGDYERPFPIYRRLAATPRAILAWARRRSLILEYGACYESWLQCRLREQLRLTGERWSTVRAFVLTLTFGRVDIGATDFVLLLRR